MLIRLLLIWLIGMIVGLLWTWWAARGPIDVIARSLTLLFGTLFSIFWPVVVICWAAGGAAVVAYHPEEIEP